MNEIAQNLWAVTMHGMRKESAEDASFFAFVLSVLAGASVALVWFDVVPALFSLTAVLCGAIDAYFLGSLLLRANACGQRLRQEAENEASKADA